MQKLPSISTRPGICSMPHLMNAVSDLLGPQENLSGQQGFRCTYTFYFLFNTFVNWYLNIFNKSNRTGGYNLRQNYTVSPRYKYKGKVLRQNIQKITRTTQKRGSQVLMSIISYEKASPAFREVTWDTGGRFQVFVLLGTTRSPQPSPI